MLTAKNAQSAAFFFRDGLPQPDLATGRQLCLSYSLAAEASFAFIKEAGILPDAPNMAKLKDIIYDTPSLRLFAAVDALKRERRQELTEAIQRKLQQRTDSDIVLAPSSLPFVWRSSSIFLIEGNEMTGENRVRLNIRSHRTDQMIARTIASGSGYMSAHCGIETAEETAAKELREESGIEIDPSQIVPLGYAMHKIPMKMPMLDTTEGGKVPGLMTEFTYYGYHRLPKNGAVDITLNSENFGSTSFSYKDLQVLAAGHSIDGVFHASLAPFAQEFIGAARAEAEKEGMPFTFERLAKHAQETGVLHKDHHGQKGKLALHDPITVKVSPADFQMGKVNWIADAMMTLQQAGQPSSPADLAYVERNSAIDLPESECVRGLTGILPPGQQPSFTKLQL